MKDEKSIIPCFECELRFDCLIYPYLKKDVERILMMNCKKSPIRSEIIRNE